MSIVKHISPGSAFKLGSVVYGFVGLIFGAFVSLAALLGMALPAASQSSRGGAFFGVLAVILFPILYAVFGGVFTAIAASIYNLAARWVGGLRIEIG
jgi:hypothetical protein